jgi:VWFA-related protein
MTPSARRWPVAAIGLAGSIALLAAQEPQQLEPFRTEVNYIRVDLYPTAGGKPVTDLQRSEIEILDEGEPQTIDRFEHVLIRGARSQDVRREPATVAEMREAVQDVRSRLFVLFLDTEHVEFAPSMNVKGPLIQALNQLIGGDDLVAVMTPDMQARDLTFQRRTASMEELLKSVWSARDHRLKENPEEDDYAACYPAVDARKQIPDDAGIAQQMILRRREVRTLDALDALVRHLRFVREERKAVVAISQGWRLFGDDPTLRRPLEDNPVPATTPFGVDPRSGRLGALDRTSLAGVDLLRKCEHDRQALSTLQNDQRFLDILRQANTGNTTFYPVDPRGLVTFDEHMIPVAGVGQYNPPIDIVEDASRLRARNESLRTMAQATDGVAVVQAGDLAAGMRRVVEDLSSYYLIGYYSTRSLDGRFHRLTVRVKRPGVLVRARTGYLAATRDDEAKARVAAAATSAARPVDPQAKAVELSLSALGIFSRERPLRLHVAAGYLPSNVAAIWAVAEVPATSGRHDWIDGGQADAMLIDASGQTVASERLTIAPGARSLRFTIGSRTTLPPGDYQVQLRTRGASAALPANESVRISVPTAPGAAGAIVLRRGVTTGNQPMPTADLRFRRTDRIIVEVPTTGTDTGGARLLDRTGTAMPIPVAAAIREDADGSRWRTAQLALAPLAAGDYLIEISAGSEKTLTAFRVLP